MSISCIIVNYRKAAQCVDCIRSLKAQSTGLDVRIVVVDNSCSPDELRLLQTQQSDDCEIIESHDNIGYTRGVNLAISRSCAAEFTVLVSPDVFLNDCNTLEHMARILIELPEVGILGSVQINEDGTIAEVARRYPSPLRLIARRLTSKRSDLDLNLRAVEGGGDHLVYVDWLQSSFLMTRTDLLERIGGLDERYFLFMSDIDFCRKVQALGYKVAVNAEKDVFADGIRASRGSLLAIVTSRVLRLHVRDAVLYYLHSDWQKRIFGI